MYWAYRLFHEERLHVLASNQTNIPCFPIKKVVVDEIYCRYVLYMYKMNEEHIIYSVQVVAYVELNLCSGLLVIQPQR